jgi:hypothetical protein
MNNIFQHLPNDLIIRIIREADGGRPAHEKKFSLVMADLADLGENCGGGWVYDYHDGETMSDGSAEMLFDNWASGHLNMPSSDAVNTANCWRSPRATGFVKNLRTNPDSKFYKEVDSYWFDFSHLAPYN